MKTLVQLALFAMTASLAQAQGTYSEAGERPYIDRQDWRGLLGYNQAWTRAEPNNATAWYGLGMTYRVGFNQLNDAADSFRRALALNPEWPEAWAQLSSAYSNMPGRHEQVLQTLREERQHMSRAGSEDWFKLGLNFDNAGSFKDLEPFNEAISAYTQSLRMNPRQADTWNNRGSAEQSLGQNAAALSDFQHAAQLGLAVGAKNYNQLQQILAAETAAAANRSNAPRPGTSGCYRSINPSCNNDPNSANYNENHPDHPN